LLIFHFSFVIRPSPRRVARETVTAMNSITSANPARIGHESGSIVPRLDGVGVEVGDGVGVREGTSVGVVVGEGVGVNVGVGGGVGVAVGVGG
jgi:hypothetical protein